MLFAGGLQFAVNGCEVIEFAGHFGGPVKGGVVFQHQLPENVVDAVELLEAGGAVEQGEGIFAHLEEPPYLGEVGFLAVVGLQAGVVPGVLLEFPGAALVVYGQPVLQALVVPFRDQPQALEVTGGGAAAIHPE